MPHRIFIVEDHAIIRKSYEMLMNHEADLEICGMAASGEEGLPLIPQLQPDLVLVDISLPGMSGFELLRRLRETQPALPVLVVSGHCDEHYANQAREAGATALVDKGDSDRLLDTIRRTLG